jgi:hypothetical protein
MGVFVIVSSGMAADRVICEAELSDKPTKDGFARIILTCGEKVIINKDTPLKMYVNKGVVVFDQSNVKK